MFIACFASAQLFAQDGSLDTTFKVKVPQYARSVQRLSDGKILVFSVGNAAIVGNYNFYNADGSKNSTIIHNVPSQNGPNANWITDITEQADGKIILCGGTGSPKIYRYQYNATKDTLVRDTAFMNRVGTGANFNIYETIIEPDGKIVICGKFTMFNGTSKGGICRLNADGTLDNTFGATGTTHSVGIATVKRLNDGKYLVGGEFGTFNGQTRYNGFIRLNQNGSVDTTFTANTNNFSLIAMQSSGKFIGWDGNNVVRTNVDGNIDNSFSNFHTAKSGNTTADPIGLHVQKDDKIIVIGEFAKSGSITNLNRMVRLNANGGIDSTFDIGSGPSHTITCSRLCNDGKLYVGGVLFSYNGITGFDYLARVHNAQGALTPEHLDGGGSTATEKVAEEEEQISVYPNPANDAVQFTIPSFQHSTLYITDLQGRIMYEQSPTGKTLKVSTGHFAKGIYFYLIRTAEAKIVSGKFYIE